MTDPHHRPIDATAGPDKTQEAHDPPEITALIAGPRQSFTIRERIALTYEYHGGWSLVLRVLTFPLRFTPLKRFLDRRPSTGKARRVAARRWYRERGRPVTIVIPSYKDAEDVATLVASLRRTTDNKQVRIVVADDASGPEHVAALRRIAGIDVVVGESNAGFAANVNRGIRAAAGSDDVVVLNSDVIAERDWLESLQYAASTRMDDVGIVGPKLLYPDGRIQFGGTVRNLGAPEWFDHRYRFRPSDWGPANVPGPVLAVSGACMYLTRELIDRVGLFDERYPMAYEDVDLCLRGWQAGFRTLYWPAAELRHMESVTRGTEVGERERVSQRTFWQNWGTFFDARDVRTANDALRVVYVTEDTGIGGGHRDIFEHLNGLLDRGHDAQLWTLGDPPDWFELRAPVHSFEDYDELIRALAPVKAIKIATWWNTSRAVWEASLTCGIPVYFVQDIETSYYPSNPTLQDAVLASYRPEFRYMTISSWNRERLAELGLDAALIPPGIDLANFRPLPAVKRRTDMVLAVGRSNPLKNLPLTLEAWRRLPEPRPELCLFGVEPEVVTDPEVRYVTKPSDAEVNELFNQATVFVQTSVHEGFCLPALESMASGGAVVCTDAHGNRDFCNDGENCLIPESDPAAVASAITRLLSDKPLRERLGQAGVATARDYDWTLRLDALERFLVETAKPRAIEATTDAVPQARIAPRR
jgi:GT2 family glycosyltransferase